MRFKTTKDLLGISEYFNPNWMDSDTLQLPPTYDWDYKRPMKIEDVDIWEVICEEGGGWGVYASWCPYAEFYIIRVGWELEKNGWGVEAYYGPGAQKMVINRMKELNMPFSLTKKWVEPDKMYLYE